MVDHERTVYGGVDTHKEFHVAAVVDEIGRILGTETFPATAAGYRRLARWLDSHGTIAKVGVEGTGAYGLGLARFLTARGIEVVEVNRPNRQLRRRRGKSDTVDAEAAARAVLNGEATSVPKAADGIVEAIRALRIVFCSTRNHRTRIANQIRDLLVTAPDQLREALEPLDTDERVARAARFRCGEGSEPAETTKAALRTLARQHQMLTNDLDALRTRLDELTTQANPALRNAVGIGPDVASILLVAAGDNPERLTSDAAFAALCGASPVEASSGKHVGHRLNKGGNRDANHALWRIVMVRMTCHQPTKDYVARRRAQGKSQQFIIRCLKRYVAREIHQLLLHPQLATTGRDLREARRRAGHTQHDIADALSVAPARISEIENNRRCNHEIINRYRDWLNTHTTTCAA
ncbi:MAG TPA: IS110 family transposase [Acidimicrobiales bacterium]|nr:IS110 family transposase [Acidimicrobiales bacterium]